MAVVLGLALGALAHNVPAVIASFVVPDTPGRECGEQAIVECAVGAAPQAIGDTVVFGFIVLSITMLLATSGVLLLVVGAGLNRRVTPPDPAAIQRKTSRSAARLARVALGTSLLIPGVWLVASATGFS